MRVSARMFPAVAFAAATLASAGCMDANMMAEVAARGGDVRYDPATGSAYRLYQYFPEDEVYHSVYDYRWYWKNENGHWRHGPSLPESVTIEESNYGFVELATSRPYGRHDEVVELHPSSAMLRVEIARLDAEWEQQQMELQLDRTHQQPTAIASVPTD